MMSKVYNPIKDSESVVGGYKWMSVTVETKGLKKSLLKDKLVATPNLFIRYTTLTNIANLASGKQKLIPLCIDTIDMDCIIIYNDGRKEFSMWNIRNNGTFYLNGLPFSKVKTGNIKSITFFDDLRYREDFSEYWTESGFSYLKAGKLLEEKREEMLLNM